MIYGRQWLAWILNCLFFSLVYYVRLFCLICYFLLPHVWWNKVVYNPPPENGDQYLRAVLRSPASTCATNIFLSGGHQRHHITSGGHQMLYGGHQIKNICGTGTSGAPYCFHKRARMADVLTKRIDPNRESELSRQGWNLVQKLLHLAKSD